MSREETLRFGIDSAGLTDNVVHIIAELCGEAAGLLRGEDKAGDRQVWRQGQDHQRREEQGRHLRRRPQGHRGHLGWEGGLFYIYQGTYRVTHLVG